MHAISSLPNSEHVIFFEIACFNKLNTATQTASEHDVENNTSRSLVCIVSSVNDKFKLHIDFS